jgi:type I restriction enzyme S subunit
MEFDGENKYIRITDIDDNSNKFLQEGLTTPSIDFASFDSFLLKKGDVLFARTGASVGKTYIYDEKDGKVYYAGFLIRARIKGKYDPEFVFQNTLTKNYNNFIRITSQRSGQPGVNAQEYASYSMMVPCQKEQEKIGNFFKQLDDSITFYQQELTTLKQTKQGFLRKMFPGEGETVPKIRFPGFTGDWAKLRLEELLVERNEQMPEDVEFPLMSFTATEGVTPKSDRYNRGFLVKSAQKKYKKTVKNDLIYSSNNLDVGSIGLNNTGNAVISPVYSIFYVRDGITSDFMGKLIQRKEFINKMLRYRQGVVYGQWRIHESDFLNIETLIPSSAEQSVIGTFFKQLDETIALQQHELKTLKQTKKAFLQKMFI